MCNETMKTRKLFTLLLLWLTAAGAWAQNAIVVYQKDGKVARFAFTENPVVTYSAGELVMTTNKTSVQYPINRLLKIYFDVPAAPDGIKDVETSRSEDVQFAFRDGALVVSGGEAGAIVNLYRLDGVSAGQFRLDGNGSVTIPTGSLSKGVYIVKTNQVSFKFRKP